MAPMLFTKAILNNTHIDVFNYGSMMRDFTYIDDVVESVVRILNKSAIADSNFDPLHPKPSSSNAPYRIFNVGNHHPTSLMDFITTLESTIGIKAKLNFLPMQPGDVVSTFADTRALNSWIDYQPSTNIKIGIGKFIEWYLVYYKYNQTPTLNHQ
jgi:UDP-glucuronate 4-epimerase